MDAIETHDFEKRNMTIIETKNGKILEKPTGAFIVETKNGKILYEYTVLPNFEDFDEEKMCSYGIGTVAYGYLEEGDEVFDVEEKEFRVYATGPEGIPHDVWREVASDVLWFSRHDMTEEQMDALVSIYGPVLIHQINKTVKSASELENEIKNSDVVAVVAPIELQAEFLKVADGIPVISCRNKRILIQNQEGTETKVEFVFNGWYEIEKIDIVTRDL
jgi:hypothetical protein